MEAKVYNQKGGIDGTIALPEKIFSAKWRPDLVHQVVESMRSNSRAGTADVKDRGDVRGGGRKPWKQKGTGRARHGSTRSPIWVGGGVTHGPLKEKNYKRRVTKRMRAEALFSVLSKKMKDGEIIFVDSLVLPEIKTKEAEKVMQNLAKASGVKLLASAKEKRTLAALWDRSASKEKSFRNLPQLELAFLKDLNPLSVLNYKYLLVENPAEGIKFLNGRVA